MPKTLGPSITPHNNSTTNGDKASLSSSLAIHSGIARTRLICTRKRVKAGPSMQTPNYSNRYRGPIVKRSMCDKFDGNVYSASGRDVQDREAAVPANLRQVCQRDHGGYGAGCRWRLPWHDSQFLHVGFHDTAAG